MPIYNDCLLRPMETGDLKRVFTWRNSERIRQHMFSDHIINLEEHEAWFHRVLTSDTDLYFIFEVSSRPVGLVSFNDINERHQRCTWGFYLGEENLPSGTGAAMGFFALNHLFTRTTIRKVIGEVLKTNTVSHGYHRKLGFTVDGGLRDHIRRHNSFVNVIVYSLFRHEWDAQKNDLYKTIFREC